MRYMALPVSFRWDEGFVRRIDEARGLVPRSAFVRSAVEQALSEAKGPVKHEQADPGPVPSDRRGLPPEGVRSATPAEQPRDEVYIPEDPEVQDRMLGFRVRSSAAARPFRPAPKGSK